MFYEGYAMKDRLMLFVIGGVSWGTVLFFFDKLKSFIEQLLSGQSAWLISLAVYFIAYLFAVHIFPYVLSELYFRN